MVPDGQHAENKRHQHRYEGNGKEVELSLRQHCNHGIDSARQHGRRHKLLRRPREYRRHAGEQVDEHPAGSRGDQPDDDRGKNPQAVIERLMRARIANQGNEKDLK